MEAKAYAKFVRISPRKVGVVLDLIRGKDVKYAEAVLKHTPKAACEPLKRIRPRAQGRAFRINKRTSHITLVLKEKED